MAFNDISSPATHAEAMVHLQHRVNTLEELDRHCITSSTRATVKYIKKALIAREEAARLKQKQPKLREDFMRLEGEVKALQDMASVAGQEWRKIHEACVLLSMVRGRFNQLQEAISHAADTYTVGLTNANVRISEGSEVQVTGNLDDVPAIER